MDMEFKVGDLVRLKSGGPVMTITCIGEEPIDLLPDEIFEGLEDGYIGVTYFPETKSTNCVHSHRQAYGKPTWCAFPVECLCPVESGIPD